MKKEKIGNTALVNLKLLADLGVAEARKYHSELGVESKLLDRLPKNARLSLASVTEILYKSANERIRRFHNPVILDLACGFGTRGFRMVPEGYQYVGGDLSGVVNHINEGIGERAPYQEFLEGFKTVDVADPAQMQEALAGTSGAVTIVTQGLLSYLTAEQKHLLCENVKGILAERGGVWLIPDANPDRMLKDTFHAIMGSSQLVQWVYGLRNKMLKMKAEENINWKSLDQIKEGLEAEGFETRVEPLWMDGLDMKVLAQLDVSQQEALIHCWRNLNSVCAYYQPDEGENM